MHDHNYVMRNCGDFETEGQNDVKFEIPSFSARDANLYEVSETLWTQRHIDDNNKPLNSMFRFDQCKIIIIPWWKTTVTGMMLRWKAKEIQ